MTTKSKGTPGPLDPSNGRDAIESITAERDRLREILAEVMEELKKISALPNNGYEDMRTVAALDVAKNTAESAIRKAEGGE